jgi:hypothetical protein
MARTANYLQTIQRTAFLNEVTDGLNLDTCNGAFKLYVCDISAVLVLMLAVMKLLTEDCYFKVIRIGFPLKNINLLKPSGHYMHMLEHCILPTECVCVFHMVLTINSDCFHKRHEPVGLCSGDGTCFL